MALEKQFRLEGFYIYRLWMQPRLEGPQAEEAPTGALFLLQPLHEAGADVCQTLPRQAGPCCSTYQHEWAFSALFIPLVPWRHVDQSKEKAEGNTPIPGTQTVPTLNSLPNTHREGTTTMASQNTETTSSLWTEEAVWLAVSI